MESGVLAPAHTCHFQRSPEQHGYSSHATWNNRTELKESNNVKQRSKETRKIDKDNVTAPRAVAQELERAERERERENVLRRSGRGRLRRSPEVADTRRPRVRGPRFRARVRGLTR